jgi:hypothetical protein
MESGTQLASSEEGTQLFQNLHYSQGGFKQCGRELTMTDKQICAVKMYVFFEHYVHAGMACNRQNI